MSSWNNDTAQWYADNYGEYATNRLCVDALTLFTDATIIDIGCGTGSALRHASGQVTQGCLIGVDPVPRMIEIAKEKTASHCAADRIKFYLAAAEKLPVENACADFVLAFDSFDHWKSPLKGLSEVKRILKETGQLVIVKDSGLAHASKSRKVFFDALKTKGFNVATEKQINDKDVSFTYWICTVAI